MPVSVEDIFSLVELHMVWIFPMISQQLAFKYVDCWGALSLRKGGS